MNIYTSQVEYHVKVRRMLLLLFKGYESLCRMEPVRFWYLVLDYSASSWEYIGPLIVSPVSNSFVNRLFSCCIKTITAYTVSGPMNSNNNSHNVNGSKSSSLMVNGVLSL